MIFTEPEVTNCSRKIALVIIRENKTKIARVIAINHLAVIIARENEVLNQSTRTIFDNHQCFLTNI